MTGKRRGAFRSAKGKSKYIKSEKSASEKSEVPTATEVSFAAPSFYSTTRERTTSSADFVVLEGSDEPTPIIDVGKDDSLIIEEVGKESAAKDSVFVSEVHSVTRSRGMTKSYATYSEWDEDEALNDA